jgi:segregation and condensation protein B
MNFENDNVAKIKKNSEENTHFFESVRLVEALLFASAKPLDRVSLQSRIPEEIDINLVLENIEKVYSTRGVNLCDIGNAVAFRTASDLAESLRMTVAVKRKLSSAAIETMAIIAYHQPVTRGDIEAIRGVNVSKGTLDTLLEAWVDSAKGTSKNPRASIAMGNH